MKRNYGEILTDHFKKYPDHLTYRCVQPMENGKYKLVWMATPSRDSRTHLQFPNLQALERYLDRHYKYSIETRKEMIKNA